METDLSPGPKRPDQSEILIVEDETSLLDLISTALRFAGYRTRTAQTGSDAITAARAAEPDLIVLDVNLPDLDGFEVCRLIRHDGLKAPVIFLTARNTHEDLRAGFGGGGDDYMTKPFQLEELALRIEAVLRRTRSGQPDKRLVCGNLVLDEQSFLVTVADNPVALSPTEFRLLRYLMLNRGRVLTKSRILNFVWESNFETGIGVVETYISYLRKKLGPASSAQIKTVRGFGYQLLPPKD